MIFLHFEAEAGVNLFLSRKRLGFVITRNHLHKYKMRAYTLALGSFKQRQHDFGQLGRGFFEAASSTPLMQNVIAGNCGLYHTLLVDAEGTVYSCGKGGGGRLGNGTEEDVYFPHPSFQLDPHLRSISCGSLHNAVVTSNGELYTWGFDSVSMFLL